MTYAKTKFGKIHYETSGSGEPVVLIRGLGRWSEHWHGFDKRLAEKYRVIKFDSRGLGKSTAPLVPWTGMAGLADDVALILRTERIASAHIVGTSLGGMIALEFAARYPEMTKSVTAINSSVGRSGHRRMSWEASRILIKAAKLGDKIYPDLARILLASTASKEMIDGLAAEWQEIDRNYPQPTATVIQQLLIALRWRSVSSFASKIKSPVQIVLSDDDLFVPRGNSLFLASRINGAVLTRLPNAGHEAHIDQPEALEKALTAFFHQVKA